MKILLWSVGKSHDPAIKVAIDDFSNRIHNYFKCQWEIITPAKTGIINEQKDKEGKTILSKLEKQDFLIALDENGKQVSSEELAMHIQSCANNSIKKLVFVIGGAYGLSNEVLQRANFKWSLSKLVFPHQLVRLILAEQIYRACTILKNEKYHHQ